MKMPPTRRRSAGVARFATLLLLLLGGCKSCPHDVDIAPPALSRPIPEGMELRVMTMNVQCIPFVSSAGETRVTKIAEWILEHDVDVIGFQEAMLERPRTRLLDELNEGTEPGAPRYHGEYFDCKVGSGLFIVSNRPIVASYFRPYEVQGPALDSGFDWWGGKGIAMVRIDLGDGSHLNFIDTHVISFYPRGVDGLLEARFAQMKQLGEFINEVAATGGSTIVVGDLNCGEADEEWQLLDRTAHLVPLFDGPTDIDFIFGAQHDAPLRWNTLESTVLRRRHRAQDGQRYVLSDHDGLVARVSLDDTTTNGVTPEAR